MTVSADFARTVVDPKAYADGRIDPVFARLRREAPVARIVAEGYWPFWLVSRRADDFNNGGGPITLTSIAAEHDMAQHPGGVRTLVQMDALDHLAFRRLTQVWFMRRTCGPSRAASARLRGSSWTGWRPSAGNATSPTTSRSTTRCG